MNRVSLPGAIVGNEFVLPRPRLRAAMPVMTSESPAATATLPVGPAIRRDFTPPDNYGHFSLAERAGNLLHRYSLAVFALLFLLVASSGIEVSARYWAAHLAATARPLVAGSTATSTTGLNTSIASYQLDNELQTVTSQPATLTVGGQTLSISYNTIKSWLQITPEPGKTVYAIHVDPAAISRSLAKLAGQYTKAPVDQVTTVSSGSTPAAVIIPGVNGTALGDSAGLTRQALQIAKGVLKGTGLQFSTPLKSVPFRTVTTAAFGNLLDVDVTTGQLFAYQDGQLVNTFPITVGASATPTPLGEFHIWQKLPSATIVNYNAKGTRHTQFSVPWASDFDHSGDAICGSTTSSHSCVGLPASQAQWVYSWAPIGSTVIIHS